jgi:hypothetical protein
MRHHWLTLSILWLTTNVLDIGTTVMLHAWFPGMVMEANPVVYLFGWGAAFVVKAILTVGAPLLFLLFPPTQMRLLLATSTGMLLIVVLCNAVLLMRLVWAIAR